MTGIYFGPINYLGMTPEAMACQLSTGLGVPGGYHGPVRMIGPILPLGAGSTPMEDAAKAFAGLAEALRTAAGDSADSMNMLSNLWSGPAASQAKAGFDNHAAWLHANAAAADTSATQARAAVAAYNLAKSVVVPAGQVGWAAYQAQVAAASSGAAATPGGSLSMAAMSTLYAASKGMAASAMTVYDSTMFTVTGLLPPPVPPPDIAAPGGGPTTTFPASMGGSPVSAPVSYVPGPAGGGPGPGNPVSQPPGSNPPVGGPQPPPGSPQPPSAGGDPTPGSPGGPQGGQGSPDTMTPDGTGTAQPVSTDTGGAYSDGAQGSTTLAWLNGGVGSAVSLSLARGGIGAMSSPASGFRMPGTWKSSGRSFGAGVGEPEPEPMAPRRGVVAPSAQMRRRRDEERKPGKVFVPGEALDVPVLEEPPAIGVIEYADE